MTNFVEHPEELLDRALRGDISPDETRRLEEHVAGCARCAAFVASYCETPRILRAATRSVLPADVEASLKAFLRARTGTFN